METTYSDLRKKVKAIQDLDKRSVAEVIITWLVLALDTRYPTNRKKAFEILRKKSWSDVRAEIIQISKSQ